MSRLFRVTLVVLLVLVAPVGFVLAVLPVVIVPWSGVVAAVIIPVYVAVCLLLLRRSPMWPAEASRWWILAALAWGGGVSIVAALAQGPLVDLSPEVLEYAWAGAYPEEFVKGLGVVCVVCACRRLDRPWHAMIVGAVVGLGFDVVENVGYGALGGLWDAHSDLRGALRGWGVRVAAGGPLHLAFTALVGWGVGWALFAAGRSVWWRAGVAGAWFLAAFALHFCWNIDAFTAAKQVVVGVVLWGVFAWLVARGNRCARLDISSVRGVPPIQCFAQWRRYQDDACRCPGAVVSVRRGR